MKKFKWLSDYEKRAFVFIFIAFVWAIAWVLGMVGIRLFESEFLNFIFSGAFCLGYTWFMSIAVWELIKGKWNQLKKK